PRGAGGARRRARRAVRHRRRLAQGRRVCPLRVPRVHRDRARGMGGRDLRLHAALRVRVARGGAVKAARRLAAFGLCAALLAAPLATVRAADDDTSESRTGVLLMVVCGLAAQASIVAPVPWAGIAILSCMFGLLDAALSEDSPGTTGGHAPHP